MEWIEKRLDKIENCLDEIKIQLNSIDKTLSINTSELETHIKRTALIEAQLEPIRDSMKAQKIVLSILLGLLGLLASLTEFYKVLFRE